MILISKSNRVDKATQILEKLKQTPKTAELKINISKPQFMVYRVVSGKIPLGGDKMEQMTSYKYFGHELHIVRN